MRLGDAQAAQQALADLDKVGEVVGVSTLRWQIDRKLIRSLQVIRRQVIALAGLVELLVLTQDPLLGGGRVGPGRPGPP